MVGGEHANRVCPIPTLEISRLVAVGDIRLSMPLAQWIAQSMAELSSQIASVSHGVAMDPYALPERFQRDPADRLPSPQHGGTG